MYHDEQTKESCAKRWGDEHKICEKVESSAMLNEHKFISMKQFLSNNSSGTLGAFSKGTLRIIEDDRDFASMAQNQDELKVLKD